MKTSELQETLELLNKTVGQEAATAIVKLIEGNMSQLENTLATKSDINLIKAEFHKEISGLKTTLFASLGVFLTILTVILSLFKFLGG